MYGLVDEGAVTGECDPTEVGWCGTAWSAAEDISLDAAHRMDSDVFDHSHSLFFSLDQILILQWVTLADPIQARCL